ncbi:cupin domain-containing protein [Arthrobacter pascens]|uniref:cupin domain-containing protein n=1 Tax=Arthrobacter pascens TaxID=1677 RepID=UPI0027D84D14|nr:cupin domain-containing protein [Arthrobacter pascens]
MRFEGQTYGSGISFFLVTNNPGEGPDLHRHPYSETWTVLEGTVRFTLDDTDCTAGSGGTIVVAPGIWHRFENGGASKLVLMCMHASPHIIQEWKYPPGADRPSANGQTTN